MDINSEVGPHFYIFYQKFPTKKFPVVTDMGIIKETGLSRAKFKAIKRFGLYNWQAWKHGGKWCDSYFKDQYEDNRRGSYITLHKTTWYEAIGLVNSWDTYRWKRVFDEIPPECDIIDLNR